MGTRSLTFVYDEDGRKIINMYRHMDGYPSWHGKKLAEFLDPVIMVNGLGATPEGTTIANGSGCLAAQIVCHFKDGPGGIYLEPVTATNCGQDYEYHVKPQGEGAEIKIECYGVGGGYGGEPLRRKKLFSGGVAEFKAFCDKED